MRAVLTQLFAEGQDALAADDQETAIRTVTTAEGAFRDRLLHGCRRVRRLLGDDMDHRDDTDRQGDSGSTETGASDDRAAAAAYLTAMERRVASMGEER